MKENTGENAIILAIESSCDETAASVVENGRNVLSSIISSQIEIHKEFGGVVPEVASRKHIENINDVVSRAMIEANVKPKDIDAIAVTYGPGLVGALLVGINFAKGLSYAWEKPLIGVNHIEGHINANYIENKELKPPFLCLVVSGGHTDLVHVKDYGLYKVLGMTRDDAAGEAFDKVARAIGLGYPGGPLIDKAAKSGNKDAIKFPRAIIDDDTLDFSFSGLKSAVLNYLHNARQKNETVIIEDVAASFQEAVVDVLTTKAIRAAKQENLTTIALAGGVASNSCLRERLQEKCLSHNYIFMKPSPILCTDNAAMIACAGYYKYLSKKFADSSLNAMPNLELAN
ncbi:MAG TPA: tRNA (adenosine(37)-N6)-threonylcarbamoyltransferase complex transferase subunit TsaD [Sedimentibacter sp.]|jgi:N6-L-threonylcarbamoyladenine synthase|nr:tRNA (adenosine(37)-N6)-threonylcarbamoyltransferase complex transferase subunit TsaD [Sedimentibacter sp.]HOK49619.1 tRNA (adenosine(37)-N6)-threonylcarbamoyltransferase complex transferase subunit TsaD [Sedimentibacter sp.]HOW22313.1 tRNA (adenosine(37)-N6)-threonylcarbamoyltransferase complex transferase subunit TsaD [Sedimentibacter sp.]HRC81298.1 tRNA (adenosine(37)-N6)-threonylcarbamoyltransferase complex transferase subunit TsaD [Sedimentibacter sp.]